MTRKENAGRHGSTESSGAESWRSQDTVRANSLSGRRRGAPMKVKTDKQQKKDDDDKDNEISPGTATSPEFKNPDFKGPGLAPWERRRAADFSNYRKDLAVLEQAGNGVPSISRVPPTASASTPPWSKSNGSGDMPNSIFSGSFYNDSNEDVSQLSPGFRPGTGQTEEGGYQGEDRRPSVASATTEQHWQQARLPRKLATSHATAFERSDAVGIPGEGKSYEFREACFVLRGDNLGNQKRGGDSKHA
ncbi:adenylate cyclase [Neofusicoccum parvum]|nr:adenylate cyclase [Neofusicoccum parvum]